MLGRKASMDEMRSTAKNVIRMYSIKTEAQDSAAITDAFFSTPRRVKGVQLGIKDRILIATSEAEIIQLIAESATYEHVSDRTIHKWSKAIAKRRHQLTVSKELK